MGLEIVFAGYVLGYLCLHSGSMVPNVTAHMTLNLVAFSSVVAQPLSNFLSAALLIAAIVALIRWMHRQHGARIEPLPLSPA